MDGDLDEQLDKLERSLAIFKRATDRALGVSGSVEHLGIKFSVSRKFVIADLAPLAFFHLVEHIEGDEVSAAVLRLYDRLGPLLLCRHQWTPLKRASDQKVMNLAVQALEPAKGPHICKCCTAYALGTSLPEVGRDLP